MDTPENRTLRYQLLLDCFRTGQMNERQMQRHMAEDDAFRKFVLDALARSKADKAGE